MIFFPDAKTGMEFLEKLKEKVYIHIMS